MYLVQNKNIEYFSRFVIRTTLTHDYFNHQDYILPWLEWLFKMNFFPFLPCNSCTRIIRKQLSTINFFVRLTIKQKWAFAETRMKNASFADTCRDFRAFYFAERLVLYKLYMQKLILLKNVGNCPKNSNVFEGWVLSFWIR